MHYNNILGMNIIVHDDFPKIKLSENLDINDSFRKDYNEWLLGMFGYDNLLTDGQIVHSPILNAIAMNCRTYRNLQKEVKPNYSII